MASPRASTPDSSASREKPDKKDKMVIQLDLNYIKSLSGILKVAESVVSLIGFICVQSIPMATYLSAGGFYKFVSMTGFWLPLIILILYVLHIVEKVKFFPWLICEGIFAVVWSAFFFICGCVAASNGRIDPGWAAGAFFAFVAMGLFGFEALRKYRKWKAKEPAQGDPPSPNPNIEQPSSANAPPSRTQY